MKLVAVSEKVYASMVKAAPQEVALLRLRDVPRADVYVLTMPPDFKKGDDRTDRLEVAIIQELKKTLGERSHLIVLPSDVALQAMSADDMKKFGWVRA